MNHFGVYLIMPKITINCKTIDNIKKYLYNIIKTYTKEKVMKKQYVRVEINTVIFVGDAILESGYRAMNNVDNIGADPFNL